MDTDKSYDVAVVGAGSAGLQAALTMGRMRRSVIVLGTDRYRNDRAGHMHNFLGHDGAAPAELRDAARRDLERYDTVEVVASEVTRVAGELGAFELTLADGTRVRAGRVVLATGVVDTLPELPGLEQLFGDVVAHCPFCHGFEFTGSPVAILGAGPHVAMLAGMIEPIATGVTVLTGGEDLDDDLVKELDRREVAVRTEPVRCVSRSELGLTVDLEGGETLDVGGMFVAPTWRQATPFAEQLSLEMASSGAVAVDAMGRTSLPGVYAAGDMSQGPGLQMPLSSVLTAAASGLVAGATVVHDMVSAG